jgi:hypothetical protein
MVKYTETPFIPATSGNQIPIEPGKPGMIPAYALSVPIFSHNIRITP